MKPKSFNRDMRRELVRTLAGHGVAAGIACVASASAWDYARWWTASLISGLSVLLRLPTADPGPEPAYVFRGPLEAAADAAASGEAGELLAALALVAASILVLGLISWGRSWARLHDGTFAGDRAPTRTHGDAWLESRPSRVARRCPVWDGREAAKGVIVAGSVGDGLATVPAVHSLIRAGSNAGKTRRALAPSIAAAIDRNAHGIPTSVIVHDPKSEIRAWTEPLARRAGMEVVAIRLDEPVKSARFNPLDRAIAALGAEGVAGAVAELRELSSAIVPDAFSSGQRFFTDASRNLLTGLCLLAIADERIPDGARNLSTVLALLEPRDGKSAVKSLEELAADLPAGNPARPTGSDASYGPVCENGPPSYATRGAYDGGPRRSFVLSAHAASGNELGTPSCAAKSRAPVVRPYPAPTVQGTWTVGVPYSLQRKARPIWTALPLLSISLCDVDRPARLAVDGLGVPETDPDGGPSAGERQRVGLGPRGGDESLELGRARRRGPHLERATVAARLVLDDDRRAERLLEGLELAATAGEGAPGDRGERVAGHPGRRRAAGHAEHAGGLERLEERRGHRGVDGDVAAPAAPLGRRRHVRREHAPLGHVTIGARVRGVEEEDGQAAAHVLPGHEGEAVRLAHEVELDRDHGATSS